MKNNFLYWLKNTRSWVLFISVFLVFILLPVSLVAAHPVTIPSLLGVRIEFILFALTLFGVAAFHHHTMYVALTGLFIILELSDEIKNKQSDCVSSDNFNKINNSNTISLLTEIN